MKPLPPIHPAASIFPMLPERQLQELAQDISANGQRDPIVMWRGQLLDGRNRWMACQRANVEPLVVRRDELADPVAFVISVNIHRRHLDESQRAMAAARLRVFFEPDARERMSLGGRASAGDAEASANLQTAAPVRPDERAAELLNVSPRSVATARLVLATAIPELREQVDSGVTAVSSAAEVASLPAGEQEEIVARGPREIIAKAKEIRAKRSQEKRAERVEKIAQIAQGNRPLEQGPERFAVIYADPPWQYDEGSTDPSRVIENQYPPMPLEEIKALPVASISTPVAILYLWATSPKLEEALQVMAAWGFVYRSSRVWVKDKIGAGYWARSRHELLLIGTRGPFPTPAPEVRPDSVLEAPRSDKHSEKPAQVAKDIEQAHPGLPRVELFAREARPGWHVWGNQAPGAADDQQQTLFPEDGDNE